MKKKLTEQQAVVKMVEDCKGVMFCDAVTNVTCDKKRKRFTLKFQVNADMGEPAMEEIKRKVFGGQQKHILQVMTLDVAVLDKYMDGDY